MQNFYKRGDVSAGFPWVAGSTLGRTVGEMAFEDKKELNEGLKARLCLAP